MNEDEYQISLMELNKMSLDRKLTAYMSSLSEKIYNYVCKPKWKNGNFINWSNNNAESLNHCIKSYLNWKVITPEELIRNLKELIDIQFMDLRKALYGMGNYRLEKSILYHKWMAFSEKKKELIFQKLLKGKLGKNISSDANLELPENLCSTARKPGSRKRIRANRTNNHC